MGMIFNFITSLIRRIFYKNLNEDISGELEHDPIEAVEKNTEQPIRVQREIKKRKNYKKSLAALLENIDYAFESIRLPTKWAWTHTHPDTITGLRKMGPHIGSRNHVENFDSSTGFYEPRTYLKTLDGKWSSMMFVAFPSEKVSHDKEYMMGVFIYAVLCKKPPYFISNPSKLVIYECGAAWRDDHDKTLIWGNWYVGIERTTGEITVLKYLQQQEVSLPKRNNYLRKNRNSAIPRQKNYVRKVWTAPPMAYAGTKTNPNGHLDLNFLKKIFVDCFESWQLMENQWKVSVKKAGHRVTWAINQHETKSFFKDREAVINQDTGKKKKIIHFVSQHDRITAEGKKSTVREHIRGLNKFDWRGYAVNVIAPKFQVNIHEFDVMPVPDDEPDRQGLVYASLMGKKLADMEDSTIRKELPTIH